jgi:hypothetical protein
VGLSVNPKVACHEKDAAFGRVSLLVLLPGEMAYLICQETMRANAAGQWGWDKNRHSWCEDWSS